MTGGSIPSKSRWALAESTYRRNGKWNRRKGPASLAKVAASGVASVPNGWGRYRMGIGIRHHRTT